MCLINHMLMFWLSSLVPHWKSIFSLFLTALLFYRSPFCSNTWNGLLISAFSCCCYRFSLAQQLEGITLTTVCQCIPNLFFRAVCMCCCVHVVICACTYTVHYIFIWAYVSTRAQRMCNSVSECMSANLCQCVHKCVFCNLGSVLFGYWIPSSLHL